MRRLIAKFRDSYNVHVTTVEAKRKCESKYVIGNVGMKFHLTLQLLSQVNPAFHREQRLANQHKPQPSSRAYSYHMTSCKKKRWHLSLQLADPSLSHGYSQPTMSLSKHTKLDLQNLLTTCVRVDGQSSPVCAAWPPRHCVGLLQPQ